MPKPDEIRLRHMLDAAHEALAFAQGSTRDDLARKRMLLLSLVKDIEIIGEAASKVSPPCQAALPAIPWPDIVAMRNRLIHAYFDIDLDIVSDVVTSDLPALVPVLTQALERPIP